MKHLAIALAAVSSLVLFSPSSEARPFGRGQGFHHGGFAGHHGGRRGVRHGLRVHRPVGFRGRYRPFDGYRRVRSGGARYGYGRRYGYRRGYRGFGPAAGLGLGLAATTARPAYGGGYGGYGDRYAPVGYGYGVVRPCCSCGY